MPQSQNSGCGGRKIKSSRFSSDTRSWRPARDTWDLLSSQNQTNEKSWEPQSTRPMQQEDFQFFLGQAPSISWHLQVICNIPSTILLYMSHVHHKSLYALYHVAWASLGIPMSPRMTLNFWLSCLQFLGAGIRSICTVTCWESNPGLRADDLCLMEGGGGGWATESYICKPGDLSLKWCLTGAKHSNILQHSISWEANKAAEEI